MKSPLSLVSQRGAEEESTMPTEKEVISILREIVDPHANMNVYDMSLIHDLKVGKDSVSMVFRPTSPYCPLAIHLVMNIKRRVKAIKGVKKVDVKIKEHMQEKAINKALSEM